MFHNISPGLVLLCVVGIILTGPTILFCFLLGGVATGIAAAVFFCLLYPALYIVIVRQYG